MYNDTPMQHAVLFVQHFLASTLYGFTSCMLLAQVDASFQRNPVAFDIYRHLGGWATETEYVNVDWHGRLATACPLGNIPLPGLPLTSLNSQGPQDQALQVKTMACTMSGNESSAARAD